MEMNYAEYSAGRLIMGSLPHGKDLLASIRGLFSTASMQTATFSARGVVSDYTVGTFDPRQQVYVTHHASSSGEIVSCTGTLSSRSGEVEIFAHIVLADQQGGVTGGRLFSGTRVYSGEIRLQECIGPPPAWAYDPATGQVLWNFGGE